ncbi:MAG: hypothetical protein GX625_15375 [Clostridiaceae bacterium]|nr:hypothetical protein [Clostridiaceae bacterium]
MESRVFDDGAFTGLEAAMVFIAFLVVASIFAYVALGAGFSRLSERSRPCIQRCNTSVRLSKLLSRS